MQNQDEASYTSYTGNRWYVIQCNPLKELHAAAALREYLQMDVFLPQVRRRIRGTIQSAPIFPGYLFASVNLGEVKLSSINSTPGVARLLGIGGGPQPLPEQTVQALRDRVDALNAQGGQPAHDFHPGDQVRLTSGPLRGLEAVFLGPMTPSARVKVLLDFLGRANEVQVDVDTLEKAHNSANNTVVTTGNDLRSGRRTRGKGRRINGPRDI